MSAEIAEKLTFWQHLQHFCTAFVSLHWLDGSINFVFRFVAKISELLLAIGIVISAADFLTHGRLMQNNVGLADAWAWTQAIAIESSAGVVLLYALQAYKDKDMLKAWLYGILAILLAIVGGVMLYTQIIYSTANIDLAAHAPLWFAVSLAIARTFVSIAYVGMCRIKHVRLSGNEPTNAPAIDIQAEINNVVAGLQAQLEARIIATLQEAMQYQMQEVTRTVIKEVTQAKLIAMPKQNVPALHVIDSNNATDKNEQHALQALHDNPSMSNVELAQLLHVKDARTAKSWRQKQLAKEA